MKIWGKRGQPVITKVQQGFKNFYVFSSVSPLTGNDFSLILPYVGTNVMNIYFDEMSKVIGDKKLLLIWDGAGWHKSKDLKVPQNIKILFLPPYSPELNPVERVWKHIRKNATHNRIFNTLDDICRIVYDEINKFYPESLKKLCHCSYM